jgi:hypothetical protein
MSAEIIRKFNEMFNNGIVPDELNFNEQSQQNDLDWSKVAYNTFYKTPEYFLSKSFKLFLLVFVVLILSSSCDKKKNYDTSKAFSAYATSFQSLVIDKSLEAISIKLPQQQASNSWVGSTSAQNQIIENISKDFSISKSLFSKEEKIFFKKNWQERFFYNGKFADFK